MMALPDLDPRNGGACSNLMAKKFVNYVVGYVQLIFWVCGFLTMMFEPSSLGFMVQEHNTTAKVEAVLLMLASVVFSVLLLIGLHKNRRLFVKSYCIWVVVYLALLGLSFILSIFLKPHRFCFRDFFSTIIGFFLHVLFFLVVRCYYLLTYCHDAKRIAANQPPV